jgi:hypothetical protein
MAASRDLVELRDLDANPALSAQQATCANPRCDEQFFRTPGPGRPRDFHSEDCRRSAERDLRKTLGQIEHLQHQAEQLRARASAYIRTSVGDDPGDLGPTPQELAAAREALAEVRGMSRFLEGHQDPLAEDLLKLYHAVAPLAR